MEQAVHGVEDHLPGEQVDSQLTQNARKARERRAHRALGHAIHSWDLELLHDDGDRGPGKLGAPHIEQHLQHPPRGLDFVRLDLVAGDQLRCIPLDGHQRQAARPRGHDLRKGAPEEEQRGGRVAGLQALEQLGKLDPRHLEESHQPQELLLHGGVLGDLLLHTSLQPLQHVSELDPWHLEDRQQRRHLLLHRGLPCEAALRARSALLRLRTAGLLLTIRLPLSVLREHLGQSWRRSHGVLDKGQISMRVQILCYLAARAERS
mmetsp:Transcript_90666/g.228537  ORF Transcript_90666/g.228537 Transcript_90666/m.228537 type:complete len:263 (-) Transcript_90666:7-795(-)